MATMPPPKKVINGKEFTIVTNITSTGHLMNLTEAEYYAKTGRIITTSS